MTTLSSETPMSSEGCHDVGSLARRQRRGRERSSVRLLPPSGSCPSPCTAPRERARSPRVLRIAGCVQIQYNGSAHFWMHLLPVGASVRPSRHWIPEGHRWRPRSSSTKLAALSLEALEASKLSMWALPGNEANYRPKHPKALPKRSRNYKPQLETA